MFTNADMTLYSWTKAGYSRQIIKEVFWQDSKQSNIEKTGLVTADAIKIFIPVGSALNGLSFTTGKDLMIKGQVEIDFDNTSEASRSASLKALQGEYEVHTITVADPKLYGSTDMQHYQLSCK